MEIKERVMDFSISPEKYFDARFDGQEKLFNSRFDNLTDYVNAKFFELDKKIDTKVSELDKKIDDKFSILDKKFTWGIGLVMGFMTIIFAVLVGIHFIK